MNNMTRRYISELNAAERIEQTFLISQPQLRTTSRGDLYIAAFLCDRTGRLNGRMWQASEQVFQSLPEEGFVWVRGRTENYQNNLQMVIESIRPVDPEEIDYSDFLPGTDKNVDEMFARLQEILAQVKNPDLKRLLDAFLNDQKLMRLFRLAPAAIALHHAYLGGLLEHTLNMLEVAQRLFPLYPALDADLILTALFLHDIGKTTELHYDISFKYSDQGHLVGHIVQAALLIDRKVNELAAAGTPFPAYTYNTLQHLVVSHHGQREFGCPVMPATPEAFFVHYIDNLDSKIALTLNEIDKDNNPQNWTNFVRAIDSAVYKIRPEDQ